jgi:hypothetical protein
MLEPPSEPYETNFDQLTQPEIRSGVNKIAPVKNPRHSALLNQRQSASRIIDERYDGGITSTSYSINYRQLAPTLTEQMGRNFF